MSSGMGSDINDVIREQLNSSAETGKKSSEVLQVRLSAKKMGKRSVGHIESVSSVVNPSNTPSLSIFQTDRQSDRAESHPSN